MASKFFHVHHEFRAGKAQQWWETAQTAMAPGGGWDEAVAKNLQAGFYNHSFCPIGPEGPALYLGSPRGHHSGGISRAHPRSQRREFRAGSLDEYLQGDRP